MSFCWTVKVQLDHKLALEIVTFPLDGRIVLSQVVEIFSLKWLWPVFHHLLNFLTESISFFTTFFDEKWMSWWYTIQHTISKQVLTYRTLFFDSASIYMEEIHTTFAGKTKIPVKDFFSVWRLENLILPYFLTAALLYITFLLNNHLFLSMGGYDHNTTK